MAGANLDPADLPKIARAAGESGKPMPSWAEGKPELESAYRAGAGIEEPPADEDSDADTAPSSDDDAGGSPASDAAGTPRTSPPRSRRGSGPRRATPKPNRRKQIAQSGPKLGAAAGDLVSHPATLGSDGGGLMLAIFLYPIALAMLQYGPAGLGMWLSAKFLNKAPSTPAGGGTGGSTPGKVVAA